MASDQLSEYARKYGGHDHWLGLRSGYTPIKPLIPRFENVVDRDDQAREQIQRSKLWGFTTRELMDLDAISDSERKLKPPDLQYVALPWLDLNSTSELNPDAHPNDAEEDKYIISHRIGLMGLKQMIMEINTGDGILETMRNTAVTNSIAPLGFWRKPAWINTRMGASLKAAPAQILLTPPLSRSLEIFPVLISLMEDVHQQGFWDTIAVFKGKIHQTRAFPVGARIKLNANGNRTGLFERFGSDLQLRVTAIEELLKLNPAQRQALSFGNRFLQSAKAGQRYWDQSTAETAATKAILDQIRKPPVNLNNLSDNELQTARMQFRDMIHHLGQLMERGINAHWERINGLLELEQASGQGTGTNKIQRIALLDLNRGTTIFCNQVAEYIDSNRMNGTLRNEDAQVMFSGIHGLWQRLELCRFLIWDPNVPPSWECSDKKDEDDLQEIHSNVTDNDLLVALQNCHNLQNSRQRMQGISWFNMCRLTILYNSIDVQATGDVQQRLNLLHQAKKDLGMMMIEPEPSGCPAWWVNELNKWSAMADSIAQRIRPALTPAV